MRTFGRICYMVCLVSATAFLVLALTNIWGEVTAGSMKAMATAFAFLFASGVAFAITYPGCASDCRASHGLICASSMSTGTHACC